MKLSIVSISNKFETFEEKWIDLFHDRLSKFVKTDWIRLSAKKKLSDNDFIKKIPDKSLVVLLDENGKSWDTKELKSWIEKQEVQSTEQICFVIGGSYGFSDQIKKKYPLHISLSKFTFPHKLALLVLFEQLYRVYSWKSGSPYHHE